ncbi:hypothetical protein HU200_055235 [Digitaria exilis]|uniref:Uncharacterized protein n=1 Tax=Digitaria exilis TaxID=1010633 RepID=A0A835ANP4_9POAL|nr:hypothetical protein HU200_055235 [Digitaria exilis]
MALGRKNARRLPPALHSCHQDCGLRARHCATWDRTTSRPPHLARGEGRADQDEHLACARVAPRRGRPPALRPSRQGRRAALRSSVLCDLCLGKSLTTTRTVLHLAPGQGRS